jgi:hypothetical protein
MEPPVKLTVTADLPSQVFENFLDTVAAAGGSLEMVGRMKQTLLVDHNFTEAGLKSAIFGEETVDD